jgi:hypothetical protein
VQSAWAAGVEAPEVREFCCGFERRPHAGLRGPGCTRCSGRILQRSRAIRGIAGACGPGRFPPCTDGRWDRHAGAGVVRTTCALGRDDALSGTRHRNPTGSALGEGAQRKQAQRRLRRQCRPVDPRSTWAKPPQFLPDIGRTGTVGCRKSFKTPMGGWRCRHPALAVPPPARTGSITETLIDPMRSADASSGLKGKMGCARC